MAKLVWVHRQFICRSCNEILCLWSMVCELESKCRL